MKTKIEETQEEIFTSSDEADAQRREEAGGGYSLVTLTPEVVEIEEEVKQAEEEREGIEKILVIWRSTERLMDPLRV